MINNESDLSEYQRKLRDDNIPADEKNRITTLIYLYLKKRRLKRIEAEEE